MLVLLLLISLIIYSLSFFTSLIVQISWQDFFLVDVDKNSYFSIEPILVFKKKVNSRFSRTCQLGIAYIHYAEVGDISKVSITKFGKSPYFSTSPYCPTFFKSGMKDS